jgi:hypothetical protein
MSFRFVALFPMTSLHTRPDTVQDFLAVHGDNGFVIGQPAPGSSPYSPMALRQSAGTITFATRLHFALR